MDFTVKFLTGQGENSLHRRYETPQMHVFLTLYSDSPKSPKDPAIEENRVFWGCNIRRISMEYGYSLQSHEPQFPIILWVRIDGLHELGYRTSHQVGLIDLVVVADGGHFVLENDG